MQPVFYTPHSCCCCFQAKAASMYCNIKPHPDKNCLIFFQTPFTLRNPHFTNRCFQDVTMAVNYCDIQLLLQCLPSQKCLAGALRLLQPPSGWLIRPGQESRFCSWNEMLSTSDRDHECSATGLALSDRFAGGKKLCENVSIHLCLSVCCVEDLQSRGSQPPP